jgi:hypothetical protein
MVRSPKGEDDQAAGAAADRRGGIDREIAKGIGNAGAGTRVHGHLAKSPVPAPNSPLNRCKPGMDHEFHQFGGESIV